MSALVLCQWVETQEIDGTQHAPDISTDGAFDMFDLRTDPTPFGWALVRVWRETTWSCQGTHYELPTVGRVPANIRTEVGNALGVTIGSRMTIGQALWLRPDIAARRSSIFIGDLIIDGK